MELLKEYFKLQEQIYDHFGYKESWHVIPLEDDTDVYWMLIEGNNGRVAWSDEPFTQETIAKGTNLYDADIYTHRHLPKWVYRADDYTMVCVDTHTDGNDFLMVLDNAKECKDSDLITQFLENW